MVSKKWNILITGGAGYVGSALVPALLEAGHQVRVLDLYLYGEDVFEGYHNHENLREIKGDIRDHTSVNQALEGCDCVIHLACISNDPSFELNPDLGKTINFDCFRPLVQSAKAHGVKRFIYASSSSVYGIKDEENVTEDLSLEPLTDYSKFKAMCEQVLEEERTDGFVTCTIRPSTVCGYAKRQRLDVIVNILTNFAINKGKIRVFGGTQKRPNIHIKDMVACYKMLLEQDDEAIDGKIYNAGYDNLSVMDIAKTVKTVIGQDLEIEVLPTDDNRSYHVSSEKIRRELGFNATHTIEEAVQDLVEAFKNGKLPNSFEDSRYFNIKKMQEVELS